MRPDLGVYLDSWLELDTDRNVGVSFAPIPWSSLHNYATANGFDGDDYFDFMYLVRQLDKGYILHMQAKAKHGESKRPSE